MPETDWKMYFPASEQKEDPNKVGAGGGDCILEFEMFASCFLARGLGRSGRVC